MSINVKGDILITFRSRFRDSSSFLGKHLRMYHIDLTFKDSCTTKGGEQVAEVGGGGAQTFDCICGNS